MWQRFTEEARKAVFYAQEEAQTADSPLVHPSHLLRALLRDTAWVAGRALAMVDVTPTAVLTALEGRGADAGRPARSGRTLSKPSKAVIDRAVKIARKLKNDTIGTEHLLLAIAAGRKEAASDALQACGVEYDRLEAAVIEIQTKDGGSRAAEAPRMAGPRRTHTQRALTALQSAREAAATVGEGLISSEHVLLGLLRDSESHAARILDRAGITPEQVAAEVDRRTARYAGAIYGIRMAPRAARIEQLAAAEAAAEGVERIGTVHYLLAILREGNGIGARVLSGFDLDEVKIHDARSELGDEAEDHT